MIAIILKVLFKEDVMAELKISEMLQSQYELWEQHKDKWSPMEPKYARNSLLWMVEEMGEAIAIIKKRGETAIMDNLEVREHFTEELVDVFMYFLDVLNRYGISGEDFTNAYTKKNAYNLKRDFERDHKDFIKS